MRPNFSVYATLVIVSLVLTNGPQHVDASFWDSIPLISQIKSAVQAISGDTEGAKKTQENFLNQAPIISQAKSLGEAIAGDEEAARNTQKQFLNEFIEPVADNTPIVGHIKGEKNTMNCSCVFFVKTVFDDMHRFRKIDSKISLTMKFHSFQVAFTLPPEIRNAANKF